MITIEDLYGKWIDCADATPACKAASAVFLPKVNALLAAYAASGGVLLANPVTSTFMHHRDEVGGEQYGGFRPQDCPQGAPASSHKLGRAVDVYDPDNRLDAWVTDAILEQFGLYREAPMSTIHWCHLTDKAPGSGRRTFLP